MYIECTMNSTFTDALIGDPIHTPTLMIIVTPIDGCYIPLTVAPVV